MEIYTYKNTDFKTIFMEKIDPGPARDQNRHLKLKDLSIFRLVFNYSVYRAIFCHFIALQHNRGLKISKRENNINDSRVLLVIINIKYV